MDDLVVGEQGAGLLLSPLLALGDQRVCDVTDRVLESHRRNQESTHGSTRVNTCPLTQVLLSLFTHFIYNTDLVTYFVLLYLDFIVTKDQTAVLYTLNKKNGVDKNCVISTVRSSASSSNAR